MISDDILDAMARYGGSFVKQLIVLYRLADASNRQLIEGTFAFYFEQYAVYVRPREVARGAEPAMSQSAEDGQLV